MGSLKRKRITALLYWWEEFSRYINYKTIAIEQVVSKREFTVADFAIENTLPYCRSSLQKNCRNLKCL